MIYTYSNLGTNGAFGNQCWQIAGTMGTAISRDAEPRFPEWYYSRYFLIPEEYFEPIPEGQEVIDLSPNYLQDLSLWGNHNAVTDALSFSDEAWTFLFKNYDEILTSHDDLIAVHVRRANNLQLPDFHPVPPVEYFEEAIDEIGEGQLVVFSDDLDWCKKQNVFKDAFFTKGNDPKVNVYDLTGPAPLSLDSAALDLIFMAQCNKHIISNSSFGWWGAYLAYGPEVIYPCHKYKWYGKKLSHIDTSVMFPSYWKAI
jgi:hypothetical protein